MATIYIVSQNGKLQKKGETLQFSHRDGTISTIFPFKTNQIVVLGNMEITGSALRLLMRHGIDTVFLGTNGKFHGKLVFQESRNVFLRQKQFKLLDDNDFRLRFARSAVGGKLRNQLSFMQRIGRRRETEKNVSQIIDKMKRNTESAAEATSLASLRGYEGMGPNISFPFFGKISCRTGRFLMAGA